MAVLLMQIVAKIHFRLHNTKRCSTFVSPLSKHHKPGTHAVWDCPIIVCTTQYNGRQCQSWVSMMRLGWKDIHLTDRWVSQTHLTRWFKTCSSINVSGQRSHFRGDTLIQTVCNCLLLRLCIYSTYLQARQSLAATHPRLRIRVLQKLQADHQGLEGDKHTVYKEQMHANTQYDHINVRGLIDADWGRGRKGKWIC